MNQNAILPSSDTQALCDLVREAIRTAVPLVDYGLAHADLGYAPPAPHTPLRQAGDVLDHWREDFTVRLAAGCTLGQAQAALAATDQFLPIDADDDLALGELVNHNVYGPLRVGYGSLRDLLLGLSYVNGEGEPITVGGRTVKNKAGYDVTRLMVGSLGELGILSEVILRTYAVPEQCLGATLRIDDPAVLDDMMTDWLVADAAPTWLLMHLAVDGFALHLGYFGSKAECNARLHALKTFVGRTRSLHLVDRSERDLAGDTAHRTQQRQWRRQVPALVKIVVPPAATGFLCHSLAHQPVGEPRRMIEAYPVHGCVFVGGELDAKAAHDLDQQIDHLTQPTGGLRVWHALPTGAADIARFAPPQPDWPMLAKLKAAMDPHGVFNPGRFVGNDKVTR